MNLMNMIATAGIVFSEISGSRVSYDQFDLIYYFDISDYLATTKEFPALISNVTNACESTHKKSCKSYVEHLKHTLETIMDDIYHVNSFDFTLRIKRAIEFLGKFGHSAFGTMDAETARQYDDKINELQNATANGQVIRYNQSLIIQELIKMNNGSIKQIRKQFEEINDNFVRFDYYIDDARNMVDSVY